jgi:hypothetical protein
MNQDRAECLTPQEYDRKYRSPIFAAFAVFLAMLTVGFLLLCLVLAKLTIVVVISVIIMVLGTGLEAWACYTVFRFPRLASLRKIMLFSLCMIIGGIMFCVVMGVAKSWMKVTVTAMICEAACIFLAVPAGIWAANLPPYKENTQHMNQGSSFWSFPSYARRDFSLADMSPEMARDHSMVVLNLADSDKGSDDTKSQDDSASYSTTPWKAEVNWKWGEPTNLYPNQLYASEDFDGLQVCNLPITEAVDFPQVSQKDIEAIDVV